jgi:hypothetical protein
MLTNATTVALFAPASLSAVLTDTGQTIAALRLLGACFLYLFLRIRARSCYLCIAIRFNTGLQLNALVCTVTRPSRSCFSFLGTPHVGPHGPLLGKEAGLRKTL